MAELNVERREPPVSIAGFRLSWGAVFAGFVVAMGIEITLGLLGIALGLSAASTTGVIWAVVSILIALFVGGMVAGRLAGILRRSDGLLHGTVLWGLTTLVTVWLAWSGVSFILGQTLNLVGTTASAAVTGATNVGASAIGGAVSQAGEVDLDQLRSEIEASLRATGNPALQPESLEAAARRTADQATAGQADNETLLDRITGQVAARAGTVDRQDIVNVIAERTDLSPSEAEQVADRVESAAASLSSQVSQLASDVGAQAEDLAAGAADTIQRGAWIALLLLALSFAAAVGGAAVTARD